MCMCVLQLKSLMEHDEEEEVLAPPPEQDEDGTAAPQDGDVSTQAHRDSTTRRGGL